MLRQLLQVMLQVTRRQAPRAAAAQDLAHEEVAQDIVQEVVVDLKAIKRNQGPEANRMAAKVAMFAYALEQEAEEDARLEEARSTEEAKQGGKEEGVGEGSATESEKYQTKPNNPENETILRSQQQILSAADAVMKLNASLTPKRRPSSD